jgi:hypothetical protein
MDHHFRTVYPRRNFPHPHLFGRIGEQLFKRLRVSPVVSNVIDVRILRFPSGRLRTRPTDAMIRSRNPVMKGSALLGLLLLGRAKRQTLLQTTDAHVGAIEDERARLIG